MKPASNIRINDFAWLIESRIRVPVANKILDQARVGTRFGTLDILAAIRRSVILHIRGTP